MAQETSRQHPIEIEGVFNVRGFGGYSSTLRPNCFTRDAILYRSGHPRDVTAWGLEQIRDLGISTIIDLTNSGETSALFTDTPSSRDQGCRVLRFPLAKHGFSVQQLSDKYKRYLEEGEKAIAEGYLKLMTDSHDVIRDILFFIRNNPNDVYLAHCAMGKDRTGIMFAILLSLSDVPDDVVAEEYSRSDSSLEPALPGLAAAIEKVLPMSATDAQALERAKIVIKTSKEAMLLTLQMVEERFGGMVQYVNEHCSIEMEDIDRIHDILTYTC